MKPLADRIRPESLDEVVGQEHIIGKNKLLNRVVASGDIPNMIFYGPSGTGKTTVANILAKQSNKSFYKLNGTSAKVDDIKSVIKQIGTLQALNGILLYIDELHYLTKRQQQTLLEYIENGDITLIGSTTENVNFSIFNALLSRSISIEFKSLSPEDIYNGLKRAISTESKRLNLQITYDDKPLRYITEVSGGDLRRALNTLGLIISSYTYTGVTELHITKEMVVECGQNKISYHDRDGDNHYNLLSYLQKSIRGSHQDGAIHALARLIKGGDLESICRRLLVISCEDIGLAYPQAASIVKSCIDIALQVGFPEAKIPLAQATILLASLPKSNSAYLAISGALRDLDSMDCGNIPSNLIDKNSNFAINNKDVYLYPHDYPNHYVKQKYMPDNIKDKVYYEYGNNKFEQNMKNYWDKIK